MADFNHHMLCLAREASGLTQSEAASRLKIGQGTYSKYEGALSSPPEDLIPEFVKVFERPTSFFFESGQAYGFPPFHFRKRKKLGVKSLNKIVAEMNIRRMHVKKLSAAYKMDSGFIPEIDRDEYQGASKQRVTMENLAQHVRELWHVPRGPIENMVQLIESNGGVVIPCDFGTDLLDAMSQRIDGMPVLFFINVNAPADRIRHTLAHELGHMILHTLSLSNDESMEDEADQFAGAFLLPADEVRSQLRKFDLRQLANLKGYWKVSMAALAVRADRLKLITEYQKKRFWMEMNQLGYRKREPGEPPSEPPKTLISMVNFHRKLGYSSVELSTLLGLLVPEFERLYGVDASQTPEPQTHLRLIKS